MIWRWLRRRDGLPEQGGMAVWHLVLWSRPLVALSVTHAPQMLGWGVAVDDEGLALSTGSVAVALTVLR